MRLLRAVYIMFGFCFCWASDCSAAVEEVSFQSRDGFIWIEVSVVGAAKPLQFLLDSGAQVSVLNTSTARRLGIKRGSPVTVVGVSGTTTGFWPQTLSALAGRIELPRNYLMLDLSKLGEACTNSTLDGIIGADFFHNRIVQIDYEKNVARILLEPPTAPELQVLPLRIRPCGMLVPVRVNDSKSQWVRLDTGCAAALQWVSGTTRPEECTRRVAVALTAISIPTTQTTLALGNSRFEGVPTDLQEKAIFPGEKGLLGNGFLSRFQTVTIDTKKKEVILGPVRSLLSQGWH